MYGGMQVGQQGGKEAETQWVKQVEEIQKEEEKQGRWNKTINKDG